MQRAWPLKKKNGDKTKPESGDGSDSKRMLKPLHPKMLLKGAVFAEVRAGDHAPTPEPLRSPCPRNGQRITLENFPPA